jgi:hypothetical protein
MKFTQESRQHHFEFNPARLWPGLLAATLLSGLVQQSAAQSVITVPLTNTVVNLGANASFTVTTGVSDPTFQWTQGSGDTVLSSGGRSASGAVIAISTTGSTSTLLLSGVGDADDGIITVNATAINPFTGAPESGSSSAILTVHHTNQVPLTIFDQPSSELNQPLGGNLYLCVTAQSSVTSNLIYQWRKNGVIIPPTDTDFEGATASCLLIPNFQATDSGAFSVEVTDGISNLVSQPAIVTPEIVTFSASSNVESAYVLPQTNWFVFTCSNTNAGKESGTPTIISNVLGGNEIWFSWTAPSVRGLGGIVTFSTLGSSFDTILGAYTGTSPSNLKQVPTVINDDDAAGYLNSQITFYALAGTNYLIAVDGFYGAQGNVVLSWAYSTETTALPTNVATPRAIVAPSNSAVTLDDPWPGHSCNWFRNGQLLATNQTNLAIASLAVTNAGLYAASLTSPTNFAIFSEPIEVQINTLQDGSTASNSVAWPKFLESANDVFNPQGQVIKLGGSGGYSSEQTFTTSPSGNPAEPNEPVLPGPSGSYPYWYTYPVAANGELEVNTDGSSYPTTFGVFSGALVAGPNPFAGLTRLGSGYYQNGLQPSVFLNLAGVPTVYIMVEGISSNELSYGSAILNVYLAIPTTPATMTASQTNGVLTVTWPASGGASLQYTSTPGIATSWLNVNPPTSPPGSSLKGPGPNYTFTTPMTGAAFFFRLGP